MAPSPAVVDAEVVEVATNVLNPSEIIETAVWLSVNQLQHRLSVFFELAD